MVTQAPATIKTISLWEPWASLIRLGTKTIETRHWATPYRGPIAIHAAKKWDRQMAALCDEWPFGDALPLDWEPALGCVVAIADLYICRQVSEELRTQIEGRLRVCWDEETITEYMWGDYTVGRYMWMLRDVRPLAEPIPLRGQQGIFDWEPPAGVVDLDARGWE